MNITRILETTKQFFGIQPQAPPEDFEVRIVNTTAPPRPKSVSPPQNKWVMATWDEASKLFITELPKQTERENQMNLFKLLQAIYEIVKQIEMVYPDSPGVVKLNAAMERLNDEIGEFIADKLPTVQKLIASAVAFLNIIGKFTKKPKQVDSPAG